MRFTDRGTWQHSPLLLSDVFVTFVIANFQAELITKLFFMLIGGFLTFSC